MVGTILYQLTRCLSEENIKKSGFDTYFIDHTTGIFPQAASGVPTDMKYIGVKGDVLADLHEDLSAEQKARVTYDNLLRLIDDRDVCEPLKFLRQREIVHYQRFGEAKREVSSKYPGGGTPTPAPFCTRKNKNNRCMKLSRIKGTLLKSVTSLFN